MGNCQVLSRSQFEDADPGVEVKTRVSIGRSSAPPSRRSGRVSAISNLPLRADAELGLGLVYSGQTRTTLAVCPAALPPTADARGSAHRGREGPRAGSRAAKKAGERRRLFRQARC